MEKPHAGDWDQSKLANQNDCSSALLEKTGSWYVVFLHFWDVTTLSMVCLKEKQKATVGKWSLEEALTVSPRDGQSMQPQQTCEVKELMLSRVLF